MTPVFLILAALFLFWLAGDLHTTLAITQITTGLVLLGLGFFLWGILEAWQFALNLSKSE